MLVCITAIVASIPAHCGSDVLPPPGAMSVDYTAVQAIFDQYCISCHSGSSAPRGLQLTDFRSFASLVDVASDEVPNLKRVKPGSASSSYLFQKINSDAPKQGKRMPSDGQLSVENQALIRDWISQGARAPNDPPSITSGLLPSATTAKPGQRISFSVAATDPNSDPLSYAWDFGDGNTRGGENVQHAYQTPGNYQVAVTVSDDRGGSASGNIAIAIVPDSDLDGDGVADAIDDDDDNDGVPDAVEIALGFSPTDAASTPATGTVSKAAMVVSGFKCKLDFARKSNDTLSAKGSFTAASASVLPNQSAVLVIGNLARVFPLNDRGSSAPGSPDKFSVKLSKAAAGVFTVRLSHASIAADILGEELSALASADKVPQPTRAILFFNNAVYQAQFTLLYTRKSTKSGSLSGQ